MDTNQNVRQAGMELVPHNTGLPKMAPDEALQADGRLDGSLTTELGADGPPTAEELEQFRRRCGDA